MTIINSFNQNINLPCSIVCSDDFKDNFIDRILDIRDEIHDRFNEFPVICVSDKTYIWIKRLFGNEISFLETVDKTVFWGCELRSVDMRDGLFDFYINEAV